MEDVIKQADGSISLTADFYARLKHNPEQIARLLPDINELNQELVGEVNVTTYDNFVNRLRSAVRETIRIKEVTLEKDVDVVGTIRDLRSTYKSELERSMDNMKQIFTNKLQKLEKAYRETFMGTHLVQFLDIVGTEGWQILMKRTSVNVCKFYNPPFAVIEGHLISRNRLYTYREPVCYLKAIYVNITHSKIMPSTINLSTNGRHPNCDVAGFGSVCAGELRDRDIPLDDPQAILALLQEIESTYKRAHLDSAYWTPDVPSNTSELNERGRQWTTSI